jgi:GTP-binding protein
VEGSFTWKQRDFIIYDTAGIRRKAKVTENIEYYSVNRAIKAISETDIIILLIDAQEGLSEQDKKITSLASDKGRGIIFALNKWDTMPSSKNLFSETQKKMNFFFAKMEFAPIIPLSAKNGDGVDKLLAETLKLHAQLNIKIETSRLNESLQQWLTEHPPPQGPQTRFNVKYAVQSSVNPVHFIFFVSRYDAVRESYISYIRNRIRQTLGFTNIPIGITVRPSAKKK